MWRLRTKLLDRLELPHRRLHETRHTVATWLVEQGVQLQAVQGTFGHSRLPTTMELYSHLSPQMRQAATRLTEELVSPVREEDARDAR